MNHSSVLVETDCLPKGLLQPSCIFFSYPAGITFHLAQGKGASWKLSSHFCSNVALCASSQLFKITQKGLGIDYAKGSRNKLTVC